MVITLRRDPALLMGSAALPPNLCTGERVQLRLGCLTAEAVVRASSLEAAIHLAPDLWEGLGVPLEELRLRVIAHEPPVVELGPSMGLLCPGGVTDTFLRIPWPFDHLEGEPGLFALGCEEGIDWERRQMNGYLLDTRPAATRPWVAAQIPLPAVIRLGPGVRPQVRRQLRELTGGRVFNLVRPIGSWRSHTLLAQSSTIRAHLPDTRPFRSLVDLATMLVLHGKVLVLARGCRALVVSRAEGGIRVAGATVPGVAEAAAVIRQHVGGRLAVLQQRVRTAVRVRILLVRGEGGQWRLAGHGVRGASGGTLSALSRRLALSRRDARRRLRQMERLSLAAARLLGDGVHPLGLLGFDVGVESRSGKLWLVAARTAPRQPAREDRRQAILRSQVAYGLFLASGEQQKRLPT